MKKGGREGGREVLKNSGAVRGNINSVVLLKSIDAYTTRVRYVCEIEPKGWLPTVVSEERREGGRDRENENKRTRRGKEGESV